MDVREDDLEILEAYLDGALSPGDVDALQARLRGGALNDALAELRRARELRVDAFTQLAPSEQEADGIATMILAKARASSTRVAGRIGRGWRYAAAVMAAAACVMIGVFIGRAGSNKPTKTDDRVVVREVYEVALRDASGKVIAVQKFDSIEEAQAFASDLAKWQQNGNRLANGHFVLTADRF